MATKKITDLLELTSAASGDVLPIVDISEDITKKITASNLLATKQDTLVSGTNIKTLNSTSLLGSGNIDVASNWGDIGGTLSNQTDLQNALNAKISTYDGVTYDVNALAAVSQAEYDAIGTKSATTLYFII